MPLEAIFQIGTIGISWIFLTIKISRCKCKCKRPKWSDEEGPYLCISFYLFPVFYTCLTILGIFGVSIWLKVEYYIEEFQKYEIDFSSLICITLKGKQNASVPWENLLEKFGEIMDDTTDSFVFFNYISTISFMISSAILYFMDNCSNRCCKNSKKCSQFRISCKNCLWRFTLKSDLDYDDDDVMDIEEGIELTDLPSND